MHVAVGNGTVSISSNAPTRIAMMLSSVPGGSPIELEQFVCVYYALKDSGAEILVASDGDGYPWPRRKKERNEHFVQLTKRFQADRHARDDLANTLRFSQIFVEDFDGCLCIGEAGALWKDGVRSSAAELVARFLQAGKPAAVLSNLIDIAPKGAGDGLLILADGAQPPTAIVPALLTAALHCSR